ncbi:MAG: phosphonate metabolism protein/1,5-bisphosphokinase (PRPP-forming) PhnN, partial [Burkholderiaceae bacterium]
MAGRLIYLMGPSGSGKDTVLEGLSHLMGQGCYLAPRVVTRPHTDTERGSISVSADEFAGMESCGLLAMAWQANGLAYGVPRDINDRLVAGCDVLVNGSRQYLPEARKRYQDLVPVLLCVDEGQLVQRLHARGRESGEQIRARLA